MTRLTTHILDTTIGKPVEGVRVSLYAGANDEWSELAWGTTNADGRLNDLNSSGNLQPSIYKLRFETKDYFDKKQIATFYPYIEIIFDVTDSIHYHVPVLLNPFGFTTYRGS